jgi:hypothetical protein
MDEGAYGPTLAVILLVAGCALTLWGHWPRLGGVYDDAGQAITLHHLGPWVWGKAEVAGGSQTFWGLTLRGKLMLRRFDGGELHLLHLGFPKEHIASLQGACTGSFSLRHTPQGHLSGHFYGRRFRLVEGRMQPVEHLPGQKRHWHKEVDAPHSPVAS